MDREELALRLVGMLHASGIRNVCANDFLSVRIGNTAITRKQLLVVYDWVRLGRPSQVFEKVLRNCGYQLSIMELKPKD